LTGEQPEHRRDNIPTPHMIDSAAKRFTAERSEDAEGEIKDFDEYFPPAMAVIISAFSAGSAVRKFFPGKP